jgi:hypothetical protein
VVPGFLAVWTVLDYAFGRRVLPIMVARWVFHGGLALGRSTWSNDDAMMSGWRDHDQVVRIAVRGGLSALMIARTAAPVARRTSDVRFTVCGLGSD